MVHERWKERTEPGINDRGQYHHGDEPDERKANSLAPDAPACQLANRYGRHSVHSADSGRFRVTEPGFRPLLVLADADDL